MGGGGLLIRIRWPTALDGWNGLVGARDMGYCHLDQKKLKQQRPKKGARSSRGKFPFPFVE